MGSIHNIDFIQFDANGILYEQGNAWHFEIPLLGISVSGETPSEVKELAIKKAQRDNAVLFTDRIAILKEEVKIDARPKAKRR